MQTRIKKVGLVNGIDVTGKSYKLSEMIQESYKASYRAKALNDKVLIKLTESHLMNLKRDPSDMTRLSEDLDVLQGLVDLGKNCKIKEVDEGSLKRSKKSKKSIKYSMKPASAVKESNSWKSSKKALKEGLSNFRNSAKSKVFYKELDKFNKTIAANKPITMNEAVSLYKASNSCLTHLTVELEKQPKFIGTYNECTKLLSRDNSKLLKSIQNNKIPGKSLLESFVAFTNLLLECDTPEKLDGKIYTEDADMKELDDRDVINEDADMEELDDRDVINEDADMDELDDRDVINEDTEEGTCPECGNAPCTCDPKEEINEDDEIDLDQDTDDVSVNLTPDEIKILKSILSKISSMDEDEEVSPEDETITDEEIVPEEDDSETDDIDAPVDDEPAEDYEDDQLEEDDSEDDYLEDDDEPVDEDEEVLNPNDLDDPENIDEPVDEDEDVEDPEEPSLKDKLKGISNELDEVLSDIDTDEDEEDINVDITESVKSRIKMCF